MTTSEADVAVHNEGYPPPIPATTRNAGCEWFNQGVARTACAEWMVAAKALALEQVKLDLVYVDPPFNTGATQVDRAGSYADRFGTTQDYIQWLRDRLAVTIGLMRASGSILVHVDWRTSHRVRVLLDELLGEDRFVNHLIWSYGLGGSSPRRFARKHDDILFYCIEPEAYYFDPPMVPATSNRMAGKLKKSTDVLEFPDVLNIPSINNQAHERTGYPTQKPLALVAMLVQACSPRGGNVWDPCCGSGTTVVAASRLGRKAFGSDVNPGAIAIARSRLAEIDQLPDGKFSRSAVDDRRPNETNDLDRPRPIENSH
ncbi:MAG: site-specific DNA-methyltransferase [Pyrinomonadaceae bacterium]|nr:site-specific DNA-methyltransferase [Phycisphaerales bacterium]